MSLKTTFCSLCLFPFLLFTLITPSPFLLGLGILLRSRELANPILCSVRVGACDDMNTGAGVGAETGAGTGTEVVAGVGTDAGECTAGLSKVIS